MIGYARALSNIAQREAWAAKQRKYAARHRRAGRHRIAAWISGAAYTALLCAQERNGTTIAVEIESAILRRKVAR